jgi:mRNA interferase MazF
MQEGDVVLTPVPQADGTVKNRPAIVLREMPVYRDVLVCGVSTQLHQYVPGFDDFISPAGRFCFEWPRRAIIDQVGLSCRSPS